MAGFQLIGGMEGNSRGSHWDVIIKNSTTLTKGDPINVNTDGYADLAAAGERIAGVAEGFVANDGSQLARSSGYPDVTSYAAGSSNQTTTKAKVRIYIEPGAEYKVEADATLGTTTGSDLYGGYFDITGATGAVKIDESTVDGADASAGSSGQVYSKGPDPENPTTHLRVVIREREMTA